MKIINLAEVGDYTRVDVYESPRALGGFVQSREAAMTKVTYFFRTELVGRAFPGDTLMDGLLKATAFQRLQFSEFAIVNGELIKVRYPIEDLVEAFCRSENKYAKVSIG